ncbi:MAG: hypothetical protein GY861_18065, partial [bacterium]|nr:hypothetical protein [bacterium]
LGSSFARSRSPARISEDQYFFKKPGSKPEKCSEYTIKPSSKPETCSDSTVERFILTTTETEQIIREETSTIIPKDQIVPHEDLRPDVSITQDTKGNTILKETKYKVVKLQQLVGEEDAGSNEEDRGQSMEGERVSGCR